MSAVLTLLRLVCCGAGGAVGRQFDGDSCAAPRALNERRAMEKCCIILERGGQRGLQDRSIMQTTSCLSSSRQKDISPWHHQQQFNTERSAIPEKAYPPSWMLASKAAHTALSIFNIAPTWLPRKCESRQFQVQTKQDDLVLLALAIRPSSQG